MGQTRRHCMLHGHNGSHELNIKGIIIVKEASKTSHVINVIIFK